MSYYRKGKHSKQPQYHTLWRPDCEIPGRLSSVLQWILAERPSVGSIDWITGIKRCYTYSAVISRSVERVSWEMTMQLTEQKNGWSLGLQGGRLGYIHIDFRLGLDLTDTSGTTSVIIETPCHLSSQNGDNVLIPAEPTSLSPILAPINTEIVGISIQKTGQLRVIFGNGHSLTVDPDEMYEAWQIGCPSCGLLLVCSPGGEVSVFQKNVLKRSRRSFYSPLKLMIRPVPHCAVAPRSEMHKGDSLCKLLLRCLLGTAWARHFSCSLTSVV